MIKHDIKRFISRLIITNDKWVYVPVKKTIDQQKKTFIRFSLLSIFSLVIIMLLSHLYLNLNNYGINLFSSISGKTKVYDYRFINIMIPIITVTIITFILWFYSHTIYSPIKNWRLSRLLCHASSELDLLRHHHSNQEEEPIRAIEWQFKYDSQNKKLCIKLLPGGHITPDKSNNIAKQLTSFLIMTTRSTNEWNLIDTYIDDETATINITYGQKRKRLLIDSITSIQSYEGYIKLDSELYFTPQKQVHIICVGRTGSGKTTFLKTCILSVLSDTRNTLYVCDGKSSYLSTLTPKIPVATTGEELLKMLEKINDIIHERYLKLNKHTLNEQDVTYLDIFPDDGLVYFVFDEILALFSQIEAMDKLKKTTERILPKIQMHFTSILQLGRAANVHVILSGQQIPSTILPTSSREAFGARLILGKVDPSNAIEILGIGKNSLPNIDTSNYSALLWLDGYGWDTPKPILLPYLNEDKLPFKSTLRDLISNTL